MKIKRVVSLLLSAVILGFCVIGFSACSKNAKKAFEVVLITNGNTVTDNGYMQSAWGGIQKYCDENKKSCRYYQPMRDENNSLSVETIEKYIKLAIDNGAKQIVLPGEDFAVSAAELAPNYKDVQFVLLDAYPHSTESKAQIKVANVMSASFNDFEAGYLAGYSSVIKGNTKLGFLGDSLSERSAEYGEGFINGAGFAADESGIPVYTDYAVFNSDKLNYDYSINLKPVYIKRDEAKKETFKVKVVDGIGSGVYTDGENVTVTANPAPEGKVFDHWEVKSDTEGVKDKKVNISSKNDYSMNLLVGDCDCTITAVWKDAETVRIEIADSDLTYYAPKDSEYWVEAPAAPSGYVFDKWECDNEEAVKDINSKGTTVFAGNSDIVLKPVYVKSDLPTFDVKVENGTGSGSYLAWDNVKIVADAPDEGYMFYKWENIDNQGLSTGIAMTNEYCYNTEFEMVDRYASVVEKMFDDGDTVVFAGGCRVSDSVFTATGNFDFPVYGFGCGIDEGSKGSCLASIIYDYGSAAEQCLTSFKGGEVFDADCKHKCIYVQGLFSDRSENEAAAEKLDSVIASLVAGKDLRAKNDYKCLTVNYWTK